MAPLDFTDKHIFYIVLYSTISVAAIVLNGILIYIISKFRRMRTVTNIFILNLALGDLLMAILCIPFSFISNLLLDSWPFGALMCSIVTYAQAVSVFISAYTLLAISVDRYIAILYPLRPRMTRKHGIQIIGLIWLVALLTPLPTALLSRLMPITNRVVFEVGNSTDDCVQQLVYNVSRAQPPQLSSVSPHEEYLLFLQSNNSMTAAIISPSDNHQDLNNSSCFSPQNESNLDTPTIESIASSTPDYQCMEDWSWANDIDYKSYYSILLMTLQYVLPFSVLVFTYTRIAFVVWGKRAPGEAHDERDAKMAASKRKMVKMMITCVATFSLAWLPFNILILLGDYTNVYEYEYIEYVWFVCHWLAMSHASYNPVIYIWMNARFRYGFRCVLGKCLPCLLPDNRDQTNGRSMANIFNSSQRKRLASQYYNCYSYAMADNVQSMVCHNKTNVLVPNANHRGSKESVPTKIALQKRSSCVGGTKASSSLNGKSASLNSNELVKSQSYNGEKRVTKNTDPTGPAHKDSLL